MTGKRGRPASPQAGANEAVAVILDAKRTLNLSDADLAAGARVDQSTVNRFLRAASPTLTPALIQIKEYAETLLTSGRPVGRARRSLERELAEIVVDLWDGTEVDAGRLRRLLDLVREFRTAS